MVLLHGYPDSDIPRYRRVSQVSHMQRGVIVSDHERSRDLRPRCCMHCFTDQIGQEDRRQVANTVALAISYKC